MSLTFIFLLSHFFRRFGKGNIGHYETFHDSGNIYSTQDRILTQKPTLKTQINKNHAGSTFTKSVKYSHSKSINRSFSNSVELAEIFNIYKNKEADRYLLLYAAISFFVTIFTFPIGIIFKLLPSHGVETSLIVMISGGYCLLVSLSLYRQYKISYNRIQDKKTEAIASEITN